MFDHFWYSKSGQYSLVLNQSGSCKKTQRVVHVAKFFTNFLYHKLRIYKVAGPRIDFFDVVEIKASNPAKCGWKYLL